MARSIHLGSATVLLVVAVGLQPESIADEISSDIGARISGSGAPAGLMDLLGRSGAAGGNVRPPNSANWTDQHIIDAAAEKDARVLEAIQRRASASNGDAKFAGLMIKVLEVTSGKRATLGLPGEPGYPFQFGPSGLERPDGNQTPVPPGGASFDPMPPANVYSAVTSLQLMLGHAVLTYVPDRKEKEGGKGFGNLEFNKINKDGDDRRSRKKDGRRGNRPASGRPGSIATTSDPQTATQTPASPKDIVRAVIRALITNNNDASWRLIDQVLSERIPLPITQKELLIIVVSEVAEGRDINAQFAPSILRRAIDSALKPPTDPELLRVLTRIGGAATDYYFHLNSTAHVTGGVRPAVVAGESIDETLPVNDTLALGVKDTERGLGADREREGMRLNIAVNRVLKERPGARNRTDRVVQRRTLADRDRVRPNPNTEIVGDNALSTEGDAAGIALAASVSSAAMPYVAAALWHPDSATAICKLLKNYNSGATEVLGLAAVIPVEKVRHALFESQSSMHSVGCQQLRHQGLYSSIARDPAMLNVLKALPRRRKTKELDPTAPLTVDPKASWNDATYDAVMTLRQRLRAVEAAPELRNESCIPLRLHKNHPRPDVSIFIDCPTDRSAELGESRPSATRLYYCRLRVAPESLASMQEIVDHYEKRAKGIKHEFRDAGILWYDGVRKNDEGTRQSMDVIVEVAADGEYTIELILVITEDPLDALIDSDVAAN